MTHSESLALQRHSPRSKSKSRSSSKSSDSGVHFGRSPDSSPQLDMFEWDIEDEAPEHLEPTYDQKLIIRHSPRTRKRHSPRTLTKYSPRTLNAIQGFTANPEFQSQLNRSRLARRKRIATLYMQISNILFQKGLKISTEAPIDIFGTDGPDVQTLGDRNLATIGLPIYAYANWSLLQTTPGGKFMLKNADGEDVNQDKLKSTWGRTLRNVASRFIPSFIYDMGNNTWTYEGLITAMTQYNDFVENIEKAKNLAAGKKKHSSKKHHKRSTKKPYNHSHKKSKRKYKGG